MWDDFNSFVEWGSCPFLIFWEWNGDLARSPLNIHPLIQQRQKRCITRSLMGWVWRTMDLETKPLPDNITTSPIPWVWRPMGWETKPLPDNITTSLMGWVWRPMGWETKPLPDNITTFPIPWVWRTIDLWWKRGSRE